jgi:hypothetical protein
LRNNCSEWFRIELSQFICNLLLSCMKTRFLPLTAVAICPFLAGEAFTSAAAEPTKIIELWPAGAPGANGDTAAEYDTTKSTDPLIGGKRVIRLGNVSKPTLAIYPAPKDRDTGAAVLVCPGGGYHILAMDLEGTEICDWLNSIGVTGALLKYRVPSRPGEQRSAAALQDAQRAMGQWMRSRNLLERR